MPEIHSKLSPSSAVRWLNCTPCLKMEAKMPDTAGRDAQEGTLAHSLGEKTLLYRLGEISGQKYASALRRIKSDDLYDESMMEYVNGYVYYVMEHYGDAKAICPDAICEIEARLDFSEWAETGFGTGDAVIVTDQYIEVIDLKYGRGVPVDVTDNPQLKLYGLGAYAAYRELFDVDKVIINIYQPRINNIQAYEIDITELLDWANTVVRPQAAKALAGEGEFAPSDETCRFCKARAVCKARAESLLELESFNLEAPEFIGVEDIADILRRAEGLEAWIKSLKEFAYKNLTDGKKIEGLKLVKGRGGRRTITDKAAVGHLLIQEGCKEEDVYTRDLVGVTAIEKLVGKKRFKELCGEYISRPEGKTVLAYSDDPRDEFDSLDFDTSDFE